MTGSPAANVNGGEQVASAATAPVALVTGGSDGIGRAIAARLAGRGHNVVLVARSQEDLLAARASILSMHKSRVEVVAADLNSPQALRLIDEVLARHGFHVDLLVNSAGIGQCGNFADLPADDLEGLLALNVAAPSRLIRHWLPGMRQRRRGGIINIASMGGLVPGPYQAAYYASKAYILSLSEAVAAEVKSDGIKVMAVAPGPVDTRFHARMDAEGALYRHVLPAITPDTVARWSLMGYDLGLRVVVPGLVNSLGAVFLRVLPHIVLVPIMALLLNPRRIGHRGSR